MSEREPNGRFIKGISGNPAGRGKKERELQYRDIMLSVCTPARWRVICNKAIQQAERGDSVARKWLADYIIGPPVQRQELTGAEGGAILISELAPGLVGKLKHE